MKIRDVITGEIYDVSGDELAVKFIKQSTNGHSYEAPWSALGFKLSSFKAYDLVYLRDVDGETETPGTHVWNLSVVMPEVDT